MIWRKTACSVLLALALASAGAACALESVRTGDAAAASGGKRAARPDPEAAPDPGIALEPVMAGEFALQGGDFPAAAQYYLTAAQALPDPVLAERAARIALMAGDTETAAAALQRWRALAPASPSMIAAGAGLALRRGDRDAARRDLLELLALPGDEGWRRALQALAGGGDSDLTKGLMEELFARDALPASFPAWLAFGGLAQRLGLEDLADQVVSAVVERFPSEPRAWLLQAGRLRKQGDLEGARVAIDTAVAAAPGDSGLRVAAAGELDQLGDPRAAAAVLAVGPQDPSSYSARAALLAKAEDMEGLTALYTEVRTQAGRPDPHQRLLLGQLAELLKRPDEALDWYRSVPGGPARSQAQLRIAVVLEDRDDFTGALEQLRALQSEETEDGELLRDSYLLEAELLSKHGDETAAAAAYSRGLAMLEDDPQLLYARALSYERLDRLAEAEADLRRILSIDPENVEALNALGYTLADRTERFHEALGYIQRAIALRPDAPAIIDSLGWVLHRMGRTEEALGHLRRAFELQKDPEIAAHLGEVLWVTGERREARAIWEQGQALDPDNRALKRALEKFKP